MSKKFCPSCGKQTEKFYNNLCADCFLKKINLSKQLPEKLTVYLCKECARYYVDEKHFSGLESAVENMLMDLLKRTELKSATYRITGGKIIVALKLVAGDTERIEEKEMILAQKKTVCKFCVMKKSKYYRAILQIRVVKKLEERVLFDVESQIGKIGYYDDFSFISAVEKLKEGTDFYLGSKSAAQKVATFLKKKYGAETKISRKIFGEEGGKKVYRDTILVSIK